MSATVEMIAAVPLFRQLPQKTLRRIADSFEPRSYESGDTIVVEGKEGVGFFLVGDGEVEISRHGTQLRTIGAGGWFGEMALLDDGPRSATVKAMRKTTCYSLLRWDFLAELRKSPEMAIEMLAVLSQRLRDLDERLSRI
jgi:CRP/FNR family transcriptional regulator